MKRREKMKLIYFAYKDISISLTSIIIIWNRMKKKIKKIEELKEQLKKLNQKNNTIVEKERKISYSNINFVDINGNKLKWKTKTDIACLWCCCSFDTVPCPLPIKYYKNKFHVYGCFC